MKKSLFFLLVAGVLGSLQAQNGASVTPKCITVSPAQIVQMRLKSSQAYEKQSASKPVSKQSSRTKHTPVPVLPVIGTAANINGTLDATTTAVSANQACGLIEMTHRDNISNVPTCGTGAYIAGYSINNGATWDSAITMFCNSNATMGTRYPNGVIFNPAGNTNPLMAYDAMSGPYTNGNAVTISWVSTVHGSVTFGNTNAEGSYWNNNQIGVMSENTGNLSFMSSSDDSTVHVIGEGFKENAGNTAFVVWNGAVLTTGKFHGAPADSFVWSQTRFRPHIVPSYKGFAYSMAKYDSAVFPITTPGTAWSQDGKTGYVVIFGNADSAGYNYATDQPIVYKSTDAGQTWAMMPLFNFRNIPALTAHLEATTDSTSTKIPLWYTFETGAGATQGAVDNYDLTVDYQGNLHIMGVIMSSYYCNPDSGYSVHFFANQDGYIYDVSTSAGGWKARFIDSMMTLPCNNVGRGSINTDWDSSGSTGYVGMGNRLQTSRSTDGKHIFCTWEDDVTGSLTNQLIFPDVFGQGYDVATSKAGPIHQFTNTNNNYFLCASDIVLTKVVGIDTTYTVPCAISYPQSAPSAPDDGTFPVTYYYLGTIQYNDTLYSTSSIAKVNADEFTISPNYPNPFSNTTQFNVGLANENLVSVDVYNLFGQKVYSIPSQQMSSGNHLMTINASGWSAGVYLYKVTVGNQSKTQKMVVQ